MAKSPLGKTPLGELLAERRFRVRDESGQPYSQVAVARALRRLGHRIEDRSYASIENENKTIRPGLINDLPKILPVSVLELVRAIGYDVRFEGIKDEADAVLLQAYQEASDETQRIVRLALGLEVPPPPSGRDRSFRRLAETDRQDRRGTQE